MALKTFRDSSGRTWRAWNVERTPIEGRADYLEAEFRAGWLTFECSESGERRRLSDFPPRWDGLPAEELERLCTLARPVIRLGSVHSRSPVELESPRGTVPPPEHRPG